MKIGLGLPVDDPAVLTTWARRADDGPFSSLGLLDRLVYDNPEPLVTLAVLAGATRRIRLQTEVLISPFRDGAVLAEQAATLDLLSAGPLHPRCRSGRARGRLLCRGRRLPPPRPPARRADGPAAPPVGR